MTLKEAMRDARAEANHSIESDIPGSYDWCLVYHRELERIGWKIVGPEEMANAIRAAFPENINSHVRIAANQSRISDFNQAFAKYPTIDELLSTDSKEISK